MNDRPETSATAGWDSYWRGTPDRAAYSSGGASHPAIRAFWADLFKEALDSRSASPMVDLASGNGAVIEAADAAFSGVLPELISLDISTAAVAAVARCYPDVHGLVADARAIPLRSSAFALVTSQFGIEYAGPEAFVEAARLTAPGGELALLLHIRDGAIHRECTTSLGAIQALQRAEFFPLALAMFAAGFAARHRADDAPYRAAVLRFAAARQALESILVTYGRHVASDSLLRLHSDVTRMQARMRHYDPNDLLGWLSAMDTQFRAYAKRMGSMCASAIDRQTIDTFCEELHSQEYRIRRADALGAPGELPLAWALVAERI